MSTRTPNPSQLYLVLTLGTVAAIVVVAGFWLDRQDRAMGPETPVVAYATAIGRKDLSGALDQVAAEVRGESRSFVENQLGNHYAILESAVRGDSLLDRLAGRPSGGVRVAVTLEIQEWRKVPAWRATEELPVERRDGRWYLLKPPLKPDQD
ncbi:MAG: hypothetical protein ACM3US_13295 [Sphingomonadaceae bacterium]